MWRYRLSDYKPRLLGELQRQQNSSLFCDTLLQAEGVSVPVHSCILAAVSPYLSHKLSASSFSAGQKHTLQLQDVKACTLLKLMSLFYSGELKGEGTKDQEELLSAARRLGIGCLEDGWRESQREGEVEEDQQSCKRCREAGTKREKGRGRDVEAHTGMEGSREGETEVEKRVFVDTGTQTADGQVIHPASSFALPSPNKSPVPVPCLAPSCGNPYKIISLQLFSPSLYSTPATPNCIHSEPPMVANGTKILPVAPGDDSNYPIPQEACSHSQSSDSGCNTEDLARETRGVEDDETNGKMQEKQDEMEQPSKRAEAFQEERRGTGGGVYQRMTGSAGMKRLMRMQQMDVTASTHISLKVKLRRRTRGEIWEVVGMHERDGKAVLGALKKVGVERPFKEAVSQEANTVQNTYVYHKEQETRTPLPVPLTSPNPPPYTIISSDHYNPSCDLHTPNHTRPQSAILPQLRGPIDESDEQIEKLLEDIMMGLNILPSVNLESDCNKPQHLQHNHNGAPATYQLLIPDHGARQPAVSSAHCVCCHGYRTGSDDTLSTDTGIQCFSEAQSQPRPSPMLTQHLQGPAQHLSSMTGTGIGSGDSCRDTSLSDTPDCPYQEAARVRSVTPTVLYCSDHNTCGQELHYSACQEGSSTTVLLPKLSIDSGGNAAQSPKPHSLPCGEDLFLPKCLSPLQNSLSVAKCHQTAFNHFRSHGERGQQPPQRGVSWLLMNTEIVHFPLTAMVHQEQTCPSLQDTNDPRQSKQRRSRLVCNNDSVQINGHGGTSRGVCIENKVAEKRKYKRFPATSQIVAKLKSKCDGVENLSKRPRVDTGDNTQPAKKMRKLLSCAKNSRDQLLEYNEGGTRSQVNMSVCSVSLSTNNVLAEDRERVRNPLSMSPKNTGEPKKLTEVTERSKMAARKPRSLRTIRTRGYSENTLQPGAQSDTVGSPSALGTLAKVVGITDKVEPPKRKRGRPRKIKPEEVFHPTSAVPPTAHENRDDASPRMGTQELQKTPDRMVRSKMQDAQNSEQTLSSGISALEPNGDQKQNPSPENAKGNKADKRTAICPNNKCIATAEMGTQELQKRGDKQRKYRKRMMDTNTEPDRMVRSKIQDAQNSEQTLSSCGISALEANGDQKQDPNPENAKGNKADKRTAIRPNNKRIATAEMGTQELQKRGDKQRKYRKRMMDTNTESDRMVRSIVQDTQNPEQASLCGISALEPSTDQKQNPSPENANGTKTDKDTAISPDNKRTPTKRMPTVTLKEFQELIKHRHFKTRISDGNGETKETSETENNFQKEGKALDCGQTDSGSGEVTKETKINEDATLRRDRGTINTSDGILGTLFDKEHCQIIRAGKDRSIKHGDKVEDTLKKINKPQGQDVNNNELPVETNKDDQESGNSNALQCLEVMVKYLPLGGRCPTMEPDKIEHPRGTDVEGKYLEMAPSEETGGPEEVRLEELHRSVAGQMDCKVDFSSEEIVIADEDHPLSCFAAIEELRANGVGKTGVGEEEVTNMEIDGGEEEHLLKYPDKDQNAPKSLSELYREKSAATVDSLVHSHIHLLDESKVAAASSLNPHTPQKRHPSTDIHRVIGRVEEEEEVDILSYSPEKSPQFRESGTGLNLIDLIPEEEEEEDENEIDVIGEEVSFT